MDDFYLGIVIFEGHFQLTCFVLFYFKHQQQVAAAVERAKQVTMTELNAIIGVRI